MPRLQPVDHAQTTGALRETLDGLAARLGSVPNLYLTIAQSPAALRFTLAGSEALASGTIPARIREQIDLVVSQLNGCDYCLAAHTQLGHRLKLADEQILEARQGRSDDPRTAAFLALATALVEHKGRLGDKHFAAAREAGITDAQIAETIAAVAMKIFTNYFAVAAGTEVNFPPAPPLPA